VGLLTTIGLSAKNAILIVEFAKENFEKGMNLVEAAKHAAAQRLRPILMTSFAFVMGVMPLAISSGPGSRQISSSLKTGFGLFKAVPPLGQLNFSGGSAVVTTNTAFGSISGSKKYVLS